VGERVAIDAAPLAAVEARPQRQREAAAATRRAERILTLAETTELRPSGVSRAEAAAVPARVEPGSLAGKAVVRRLASDTPPPVRQDFPQGSERTQAGPSDPAPVTERGVQPAPRGVEAPIRERPVSEATPPAAEPVIDRPVSAPPRVVIPTAPLRTDLLAQAVLSQARQLPPDAPVELRFALHPAELGTVRIRILVSGETLQVELLTSNPAATGTLNTGVPRLMQQLEAAGFPDADVRLTTDTATDHGTHGRQGERQPTRGSSPLRTPVETTPWDLSTRALDHPDRDGLSRLDRVV
jgi:hypothetical protein